MQVTIWIRCLAIAVMLAPSVAGAQEKKVLRLGMIGLDTSHVIAFTALINNEEKGFGCKVVAGYPGGSPDVKDSWERVDGFTQKLHDDFGVEIMPSIEALCEKVDGVLLMSVDGRPHLEQIKPVFAARKPVYIDKPVAGRLEDVLEIFRLARQNNVPCWSSSSLRFCEGIISMRIDDGVGEVLGCAAFSPCELESHHPDLYWYGVHGVEILYTIMGAGCQSVQRVQMPEYELVTGVWAGGRIGTFRGLRGGASDYGALVFGSKGIVRSGGYTGYAELIDEIVRFFQTGQVPVPAEETIEMFAFMSAADASKGQGGAPVSIRSVLDSAREKNKLRLRSDP